MTDQPVFPKLVEALRLRLSGIDPDHGWVVNAGHSFDGRIVIRVDRTGEEPEHPMFTAILPEQWEEADADADWVRSTVKAYVQFMRDPAFSKYPLPMDSVDLQAHLAKIRSDYGRHPRPLSRDEWTELEEMLRAGTPPSRAMMKLRPYPQ